MRKVLTLAMLLVFVSVLGKTETVPRTINYQGNLTDIGGSPINGSFDMIFSIYADSTGGSPLWTEGHPTVPVSNGLFNVTLGKITPINFADFGDVDVPGALNVYLQINIEGEDIIPRNPLNSSPYSTLSHSVIGDLYSSPGRLRLFNPGSPIDCTYVPLEMRVDAASSHFHLFPSELATPVDSVEPAIAMDVSGTSALFEVFGVEPEPFRADHREADFSVLADINQTSMSVRHAFADPDIEPEISANVNPAQSILWVMGIEPQPFITGTMAPSFAVESNDTETSMLIHHQSANAVGEADAAYMTMSSAPTTGASMLMFNPQPEPPGGPDDHTLSINGGLGDSGPGIFMFNPQPEPPGTPPYLFGVQTTPTGAMMDFQSEPAFGKAATGEISSVRISADTSGSIFSMLNEKTAGAAPGDSARAELSVNNAEGSVFEMDYKAVSGIVPCVRVAVDGASGSFLQMDHNTASGIAPCIKVFNNGLSSGFAGFDTKIGVTGGNDSALTSLSIDAVSGSIFQMDYKATSGINPCVRVSSDESSGSVLQMDYNNVSGITPCIRVFSEAAGAGMNIYGGNPPDDSKSGQVKNAGPRTADSAVINLFADTGKATIELFGGAADENASIVLISNNTGGKVGINRHVPAEALHVVGNICATGTIGACSDERFKKDITTIDDALGLIAQLRGVSFNWRTEEFPEQKFSESGQVGFIAQEIKEVLPELVSEGSDGFYSVDYAKLTPVLVEAVKEQQKSIEELKSQNSALALQLSELKSMILRLTDASEQTSGHNLAKADN